MVALVLTAAFGLLGAFSVYLARRDEEGRTFFWTMATLCALAFGFSLGSFNQDASLKNQVAALNAQLESAGEDAPERLAAPPLEPPPPAVPVPETQVPETQVPETQVPETQVSETPVPETPVLETPVSETGRDVPEAAVPPDAPLPAGQPDPPGLPHVVSLPTPDPEPSAEPAPTSPETASPPLPAPPPEPTVFAVADSPVADSAVTDTTGADAAVTDSAVTDTTVADAAVNATMADSVATDAAAAVSGVTDAADSSAAAAADATLDTLSGTWDMTTTIERTAYPAFAGLELTFRLTAEQTGDTLAAAGNKAAERAPGAARALTYTPNAANRIVLSGNFIDAATLALSFEEGGSSGGTMTLRVVSPERLEGVFLSSSAESGGPVVWRKVGD